MSVEIIVQPNGPLLVKGGCTFLSLTERIERPGVCALCRCGRSAKTPFCDGSHARGPLPWTDPNLPTTPAA